MTNMNLIQYAERLLCALAAACLLSACSDDGATIITDGTGAGNGVGNAGRPGSADSGGSAGTSATGGGGASGSGNAAACVETPTTSDEFLNRCTDSACRAFDNEQRLGLYQPGQPLPEAP